MYVKGVHKYSELYVCILLMEENILWLWVFYVYIETMCVWSLHTHLTVLLLAVYAQSGAHMLPLYTTCNESLVDKYEIMNTYGKLYIFPAVIPSMLIVWTMTCCERYMNPPVHESRITAYIFMISGIALVIASVTIAAIYVAEPYPACVKDLDRAYPAAVSTAVLLYECWFLGGVLHAFHMIRQREYVQTVHPQGTGT